MSSLSVKTNRLFFPLPPPPPLTPSPKHPRLMDCDVYRPHAELGKYPPWYHFFFLKGGVQERQCSSELVFLIRIFNNLLTKHIQKLTCISVRSPKDSSKLRTVQDLAP